MARVHQEQPKRVVEGRQILMQRLGEKAVFVHATGNARMRLQQQQVADDNANKNTDSETRLAPGGDYDVELQADDIRLIPYLATPTARRMHARGLPGFAESLQASAHASPYLFAIGKVHLIQRDLEEQVIGRGFGERLVLRFAQAARAVDGRLSGKDARLIRTDRKGRSHIAEARLIRFANDRRGQHLDLVPVADFLPRLTLPSPSGDGQQIGGNDGGSTVVTCRGRMAVTPDKVRFLGPVEVESLDRNGNVNPTGLSLSAVDTVMDRDPKTGDVTHLRVRGDIRFHFQDMDGEADEMSLNLRRHIIIARGTSKQAVLRWASGRTIKAAQVNHNYQTKQTQSWSVRLQVPPSK
jgi:hypothetical protein